MGKSSEKKNGCEMERRKKNKKRREKKERFEKKDRKGHFEQIREKKKYWAEKVCREILSKEEGSKKDFMKRGEIIKICMRHNNFCLYSIGRG